MKTKKWKEERERKESSREIKRDENKRWNERKETSIYAKLRRKKRGKKMVII